MNDQVLRFLHTHRDVGYEVLKLQILWKVTSLGIHSSNANKKESTP